MGDPNHLEKMGRELKCPICWSLLDSAVSLTCNHVFCNSCIVKSMKSGSGCPVCKIPFRRREVRPAPHMDNLVSIYKSMEVASGISIFVTQNAPATKLSDGEKQCEGDADCVKKDAGGTNQNYAHEKKPLKGKQSRKKIETSMKSSSSDFVKPSFPTKKRVQVPQNILSETPLKTAKFGDSLSEINKEGTEKGSAMANEGPFQSDKEEPVLSPFFWLREEEDGEKLSQQSVRDQLIDCPTPNPPSFSDLKDSDDENPSKVAPSDEVQNKASVNLFDSEMFEWTQRPCSPELFSSPIKMQVAATGEIDENQEDLLAASQWLETNQSSAENTKFENPKEGNRLAIVLPSSVTSPQIKSSDDKNGIKKFTKRGRKARGKTGQEKIRGQRDPIEGMDVDSNRLLEANQKQTQDNKHNASSLDKTSRRGKRVRLANVLPSSVASPQVKSSDIQNGIKKFTKRGRKAGEKTGQEQIGGQGDPIDGMDVDSNKLLEANQNPTLDNKHNSSSLDNTNNTSTNPTPQTACIVSNISGVLSNGEVKMGNNSYSSPCKQKKEKDTAEVIAGKSQRKRSGKQKMDCVQNVAEELSSMQNQISEYAGSASNSSSFQMDNNGKASNSRQNKSNFSRKSVSCNRGLRSNKKLKLSSDCISENKFSEVQPNERIQGGPDVRALNDSSKEKLCPLMDDVVLRKCESHVKKYACAFCLSSEESEASGQMVHYYNGKPVTADYEGASKVIHSHKNCTEWAPNVYFEDDNAINLEAEISRSRRIKCSFCGLKGAALGCYQKNCRRSFHVPCAKWTSQCRWDVENFVMLCPLHGSSKLPYESQGSQERRKKCMAKEQSNQCGSLACKHDASTSQSRTAHGSYKKFVLCCSALSAQERDIVSEFERVSKVTVLKKWDSSVTHVIASTDENGACKRTLKVLLGILEGKWILNIEWIRASMKEMEPVNEEGYEITADIHGIRDGPRFGRLRVLNKQPKLFDGYKFYFMGDFVPSYKGYLQDLVTAAGGMILHRKPVSSDQKEKLPDTHPCQTFIIYSLEVPDKCNPLEKDAVFSQRLRDAEALASSTGSMVASNTWILNSIAACKLQSLAQ